MSGGELSNIGRIAEKISNEIFSFFKWKVVGPTNLNYKCEKKISTLKQKMEIIIILLMWYLNTLIRMRIKKFTCILISRAMPKVQLAPLK